MKLILALVLALPLTSFAREYAACDLYASHYTSSNFQDYTLVKTERISNTWKELKNGDVTLAAQVYPVSYQVIFSLDGTIKGSLGIKIDQPGERSEAVVPWDQGLRLSVTDAFNGGKTEYNLDCGFDS